MGRTAYESQPTEAVSSPSKTNDYDGWLPTSPKADNRPGRRRYLRRVLGVRSHLFGNELLSYALKEWGNTRLHVVQNRKKSNEIRICETGNVVSRISAISF